MTVIKLFFGSHPFNWKHNTAWNRGSLSLKAGFPGSLLSLTSLGMLRKKKYSSFLQAHFTLTSKAISIARGQGGWTTRAITTERRPASALGGRQERQRGKSGRIPEVLGLASQSSIRYDLLVTKRQRNRERVQRKPKTRGTGHILLLSVILGCRTVQSTPGKLGSQSSLK